MKLRGVLTFQFLAFLVLMASALLGFQNCAPVSFSQGSGSSAAKAGGTETPDTGDNTGNGTVSTTPDDHSIDHRDDPIATATPSNSETTSPPTSTTTSATAPSTPAIMSTPHPELISDNPTSTKSTSAICVEARKQLLGKTPVELDKISGVSGNRVEYVTHVGSIHGISGHLVVVGAKSEKYKNGPSVEEVGGVSGSAIFCDISIHDLDGASGAPLGVENGDIDHVQGISGQLYLKDGDIGSVKSVSGTIRIRNGKVNGSQSSISGQIILEP